MTKSIKRPTSSSAKKKPNGKKPGKNVDILKIVEVGLDAVNSITNVINTVSEERRKTEELKLESIKINEDIKDKISERENETLRILKGYDIELEKIRKSMEENKHQSEENIQRIELEAQQSKENHEYRMKGLSIIEKIVDVALDQYRSYKTGTIIFEQNNAYVVNIELLNVMNGTIENLTSTIAQANIGGLLTSYEEE